MFDKMLQWNGSNLQYTVRNTKTCYSFFVTDFPPNDCPDVPFINYGKNEV